ncbi:MAG TPA: hypothetical protein VEI97_06555 [bacterium]|nr:hypothetical protein [bacterium]
MRLCGLLLLLAVCALPAQATPEGQVHVVGGLTRAYTLAPGSTTEGKLLLQNGGDASADVRVYQHDYAFFADGKTLYDPPGTRPRSNAPWIHITPTQVTVPAHGSATVFFSIRVPAEVPDPGTWWSVLMVEPLSAGVLEPGAGSAPGVQVGIRMRQRYAVQFVTTVGEGTAAVEFSNATVRSTGTAALQIDIANTGDLWLRPVAWAEVFGTKGESLGRFEGNKMRLYPGTSGRFTIPLPGIAPGSYTALVVADDPDGQVFGTQVALAIP